MVATYRHTDTDPKERFVHHQAGASGDGGSSYIDLVAFRERDVDDGWTGDPDGTVDERLYYCQNQHADVVALITAAGAQRELARYSAYGVPFGLPVGDVNSDGACLQADQNQVRDWALATPAVYDVRGDLDLDGDVDLTDRDTLRDNYKGVTLGRGVLSAGVVGNRRGYCGSTYEREALAAYGGRHRPFLPSLGIWSGRDVAGYIDGVALYQFTRSQPLVWRDPTGMSAVSNHHPTEPPSSQPTAPVIGAIVATQSDACTAGMVTFAEDGTTPKAGDVRKGRNELTGFSRPAIAQGITYSIRVGFLIDVQTTGACIGSGGCEFNGKMTLEFVWRYSNGNLSRSQPTNPADRRVKTKANIAIHGAFAVDKTGELRKAQAFRIWPKWRPPVVNHRGSIVTAGSSNLLDVSESLTCDDPAKFKIGFYEAEMPDGTLLSVLYSYICGCPNAQ